jgi:hypothetical protein
MSSVAPVDHDKIPDDTDDEQELQSMQQMQSESSVEDIDAAIAAFERDCSTEDGDVEHRTHGQNRLKILVAESWFSTLKRSNGSIAKIANSGMRVDNLIHELDRLVDCFTNPESSQKVLMCGEGDSNQILEAWLRELVLYFGESVMMDAGVIMLRASEFRALTRNERVSYYARSLMSVRSWFKNIKKKLKRLA